MKWKKPFNYALLFLAIVGALVFFWLQERKHKKEIEHKKESDWKAQLEHAHMQSYLQNYKEAEAEYRKLLKIDPTAIHIKVDLASILYYQKKYEEALDLLKTIPTDARNEKITILIADIYLSLNEFSQAETLYRAYLDHFPTDQDILIKLAKLLSWEKKYNESIQIYQEILTRDPKNIQVRRQYARVLMWMGKHEEAALEMKKTLPQENEKSVKTE
jgi:thioredoxin-like negative regulator of GroEL